MIFSSVEEAESWLEPVDCEAGDAICYDSIGRKLKVTAEVVTDSLWIIKWTNRVVRIRLAEPHEVDVQALRRILVSALRALAQDGDNDGLTELALEELQERAMKHCLVGATR